MSVEINRSPFLIRLMLACYYSPDPHLEIGEAWRSDSGGACRRWLTENGLITESSEVTERGKAWVQFIISTPLPEAKWVLPVRDGTGAVSAVREEIF